MFQKSPLFWQKRAETIVCFNKGAPQQSRSSTGAFSKWAPARQTNNQTYAQTRARRIARAQTYRMHSAAKESRKNQLPNPS